MRVVEVTFTVTEHVEVPDDATDKEIVTALRELYAQYFAGFLTEIKVKRRANQCV